MRNSTDLHNEFALAKVATPPVDGIIVWGSSADVTSAAKCAALGGYVNTTLGPVLLGSHGNTSVSHSHSHSQLSALSSQSPPRA